MHKKKKTFHRNKCIFVIVTHSTESAFSCEELLNRGASVVHRNPPEVGLFTVLFTFVLFPYAALPDISDLSRE